MANFVDFIHLAATSGNSKDLDDFVTEISNKNHTNPLDVDQFERTFNSKYSARGISIDTAESKKLIEANSEIRKKIGGGITPKY